MKSQTLHPQQFDLYVSQMLADYVTAIAWSPRGDLLAVSSAAGEVMLWQNDLSNSELPLVPLQTSTGHSIDCLGFGNDVLAVGGQDGLKIWHLDANITAQLAYTIENQSAWVDQLAWSPTKQQLAFSLGRKVQIWDATTQAIAATLDFEASSILGIDWSPDGKYLAIAGYQGAKIWESQDWHEDPYIFNLPSASVAIAWSPDGKYFALGNLDRTIAVFEWTNPNPWIMRGFPGKIRQLAWSTATVRGTPLLAASSIEGIAVWSKHTDDALGWENQVLQHHLGVIHAIAFQPNTLLLASAAEDGMLCLWKKAKQVVQVLEGAPQGFSCLAWHPQGQQLAAGGMNGELCIWAKSLRGQGFSR